MRVNSDSNGREWGGGGGGVTAAVRRRPLHYHVDTSHRGCNCARAIRGAQTAPFNPSVRQGSQRDREWSRKHFKIRAQLTTYASVLCVCVSREKQRKGKERKGKERKGKERKGKESNAKYVEIMVAHVVHGYLHVLHTFLPQMFQNHVFWFLHVKFMCFFCKGNVTCQFQM